MMLLSENITRAPDGTLLFAGQSVPALAERYGTPLYLMDEERIRQNCRRYTATFRECFGEDALPVYASKAASFRQMYRIAAEEGLGADVVSAGEIHTALTAGFPAEKLSQTAIGFSQIRSMVTVRFSPISYTAQSPL